MFKATTCLQLILVSIALFIVGCSGTESLPQPTATLTREPLIPTATPTEEALSVVESTVAPTAEPEPPTPLPTETPNPVPTKTRDPIVPTATPDGNTLATGTDFGRFGLSGTINSAQVAQDAGLPFSFYMNWLAHKNPPVPEGVDFWQMVRMKEGILDPSAEKIQTIAEANPGSVWLIGNEGDVKWQDSVSAETYATLYHEAYTAIKTIDPSATVSAGGIAQATPIRLAYLDNVLASYEAQFATPLPTDMWNIHAYALREERDSWGVDIPPGMDDVNTGELYEIDDHANLTIFRLNLVRFRGWMASNGYQDVPLAVTEFSILLPFDYGFPPEVIGQFMHDAFDIMLELNNETGLASDDNRLVQHWIWFWIEGSDDHYPWSNLYDSETQSLTLVGEAYRDYLIAPRP